MIVTRKELEKLKRTELCDYCRQHHIPGYSGKTKSERVKLILDYYKLPKSERPLPIGYGKEMTKKQFKRHIKKEVEAGRQKTLISNKMDPYDEEKYLTNRFFYVKKSWKIGRAIMKEGDLLKVIGYGSGGVSHYVEFLNKRIGVKSKYRTATGLFKKNTYPKDDDRPHRKDFGYQINEHDFGKFTVKDYMKEGIRTRVYYTKDGIVDHTERLN